MKKLLPIYILVAILVAYGVYQTIEVNKLKKEVSNTKNELLTLSKENKKLKSQVSDLQYDVDNLQSSNDDLDGRVSEVEDRMDNTRLITVTY
jgi:peptidoglycan hydrolase CwlO-like protein